MENFEHHVIEEFFWSGWIPARTAQEWKSNIENHVKDKIHVMESNGYEVKREFEELDRDTWKEEMIKLIYRLEFWMK